MRFPRFQPGLSRYVLRDSWMKTNQRGTQHITFAFEPRNRWGFTTQFLKTYRPRRRD
jgi:hypothetical protein